MPRAFLIDTDVASDDAVALIMALRARDVNVVAITTVAGNVEVEQATRNALYTVELCGARVPVFAGAEKPLKRVHQSATWFHGHDGLGDHGYPAPRQKPEKLHAIDAIVDAIQANPGLVVVTLGPLTNLALALARKPGIAAEVGRCVVMEAPLAVRATSTPAGEYISVIPRRRDRYAQRPCRRIGRLANLPGGCGTQLSRHPAGSGI